MGIIKYIAIWTMLLASACILCACSTPDSVRASSLSVESVPSEAKSAQPSAMATVQQSGTDAYTAYSDYEPEPQQPVDLVQGTNSSVLIAYFTHSTNAVMPDSGPDAVTSPSITVQENGAAVGNAQMIADWIAQATGGDLFAIQTAYTYPDDNEALVAVGEGQDTDGILPELLDKPLDLAQYSTVYLVYPIWHFTLPAPVRSFLAENDLAGKTIYAFATNAGSSFGSSIEAIKELEPQADVVEGVSISQHSLPDAEQDVTDAVQQIMEQTGPHASSEGEQEDNALSLMQIAIGDSTFEASLADTQAAREFSQMLQNGPVTVEMKDYSGFEKVGPIGQSLTSSNTQITTVPGDVMLYNGNQIVMFYGSNTWDYTPIARVNDLSGWNNALGDGDITAVFSLLEL